MSGSQRDGRGGSGRKATANRRRSPASPPPPRKGGRDGRETAPEIPALDPWLCADLRPETRRARAEGRAKTTRASTSRSLAATKSAAAFEESEPPPTELPTPTPPPVAYAVAERERFDEKSTDDMPAARAGVPPPPDSLAGVAMAEPRGAAPADERRSRIALVAMLASAAAIVVLILSRALAGQPPVAVASLKNVLRLGDRAVEFAARSAPREPRAVAPAAARTPRPALLRGHPRSRVRHTGHASINGGVLFAPDSFTSTEGAFDLLLHFHGNTAVVRESAEVAGLDAIVAVVNLGVGSAPYEEAYAIPGTYEALLEQIERAVARRGVQRPKLRRVALSSWSAGYGAISTILQLRKGVEALDAVLVLDGIHTGWQGERPALDARKLAPFVRTARAAAAGELLFSITHSEIDPIDYAGAADTANHLLESVGVLPSERTPVTETIPHLALRSAVGAVSKKLEKRMEPTTEATKGGLHVRGFKGNTPEHHMAHLLQMGATVLPELAARWRASRP